MRIVPNPITDANTGVKHKTLGGKVRDAGLPKSMAELGTAWLFIKEVIFSPAKRSTFAYGITYVLNKHQEKKN